MHDEFLDFLTKVQWYSFQIFLTVVFVRTLIKQIKKW